MRDLLALDIDVSAMLPADDVSYGFDNIAGVQRMSPTLMERYLAAAQKISAVAVGASPKPPTTDTFIVPPELRQDDRLEGLPFGTRGGTVLQLHVSARRRLQRARSVDAICRRQLRRDSRSFDQTQRLELSIDGKPLHVFELLPGAAARGTRIRPRTEPRGARCRLAGPVPGEGRAPNGGSGLSEPDARAAREPARAVPEAGPGRARTAITRRRRAPISAAWRSAVPYDATGAGETPSRERIFVVPAGEGTRRERRCAKKILSTLARRAFRRPVTDADLQTLLVVL